MSTKIEKFEDLDVWQNAVELSISIYKLFSGCKDYSFRDQISRASVSVPSNIAEGFERQYNKEYIHFLFIAKGSSGEVRTQLLIAFRLGYLQESDYNILLDDNRKISAQLFNLIKTRKEKFN
ncbi:MAG TPA: four helix bundle protein [Bacteroidales bacterium]|nr:four helix bundle protein [Bacteroidales bacterium]HPT20890.1 four helix bundle protein [Bacteroidales bacterium]